MTPPGKIYLRNFEPQKPWLPLAAVRRGGYGDVEYTRSDLVTGLVAAVTTLLADTELNIRHSDLQSVQSALEALKEQS